MTLQIMIPPAPSVAQAARQNAFSDEADINIENMYAQLIGNEFNQNGAKITFDPDACRFTSNTFDFMPGPRTFVVGVSTAGTVRHTKEYYDAMADSLRPKPMQMKWTLEKISRGRGFIYFQNHGAYQFAFLQNGKLWLSGAVMDASPRKRPGETQSQTLGEFLANSTHIKAGVTKKLIDREFVQNKNSFPSKLIIKRDGTVTLSSAASDEKQPTTIKLLWSFESEGDNHVLKLFDTHGQRANYPESFENKIGVKFTNSGIAIAPDLGLKSPVWQSFTQR